MVLTEEERKAKQKEYYQRPEVIARKKELRDRPEVKARKKAREANNRLNVLQHYSKLLSNSESACCNCCKESEINFLAIDHIAGKKQMDSEPELIKLGYRSTFQTNGLIRWILNNNFPKGFQVLCTNCNTAQAYPKNNNKCPLEGKPH